MKAHLLQRKCACGGSSAPCKCPDKKKVQRSASAARTPETIPPIVDRVLASSGQTLDRDIRAQFEPRFGVDFSSVRIHADAQAAESARAVSANAYTVGHDVVFAAGQYAPRTSAGARLLAHELTHVVQQGEGVAASSVDSISPAHDPSEIEADRVANGMMLNTISTRSPVLSRQAVTAEKEPPELPGRFDATHYGCYCGKGTSCPEGTPAADDLDECCRLHDILYGPCIFTSRNVFSECCFITRTADIFLRDCADRVIQQTTGDDQQSKDKREFARKTKLLFGTVQNAPCIAPTIKNGGGKEAAEKRRPILEKLREADR